MSSEFAEKYGPWAVVAGGSDGIGAGFARGLAERGVNLVLVARRAAVLEGFADEIRKAYPVDVRTVVLDLSDGGAIARLAEETADLEVGLFVANAGGDDPSLFLERDLETHLALVQRNSTAVLEAAYRFGGPMVERGHGGLLLLSSRIAWAGAATVAAYGATKAFVIILAEGLWAEWRGRGVDVLNLVVTATDTPSLQRVLQAQGGSYGGLAAPDDVAATGLDHLGDGPTWMCSAEDPLGPAPFGTLSRREAVESLSRRAMRDEGKNEGK
jgi:short-subunit dehydrogenase